MIREKFLLVRINEVLKITKYKLFLCDEINKV